MKKQLKYLSQHTTVKCLEVSIQLYINCGCTKNKVEPISSLIDMIDTVILIAFRWHNVLGKVNLGAKVESLKEECSQPTHTANC